MFNPRPILLALMLAVSLALAACEKSRITTENYDKIKVGMTMSEVTSHLGSKYDDDTPPAGYGISGGGVASSTAAPENIYVFKDKNMKIIVTVKAGKVVQKSKVDL
jgi:hypothetical protein